jgi:hypothetical protein
MYLISISKYNIFFLAYYLENDRSGFPKEPLPQFDPPEKAKTILDRHGKKHKNSYETYH